VDFLFGESMLLAQERRVRLAAVQSETRGDMYQINMQVDKSRNKECTIWVA
jgi:hypothetical protein